MKKFFSLLLVCTIILSFVTITMVSAANTNYTFKYYDVKVVSSGNPMTGYTYNVGYDSLTTPTDITIYNAEMTSTTASKAFAIGVSANELAGSGHFVIEYDCSVVVPTVILASQTGLMGQTIEDLNTDYYSTTNTLSMQSALGPQGTDAIANAGYELKNNKIALTWMAGSNSGGVNADQVIAYIGFSFKDGKTSEDFNNSTFKVANDISDISTSVITEKASSSYGALFLSTTSGDKSIVASNLSESFTYPNSDKSAGNEPEEFEIKGTADALDIEKGNDTIRPSTGATEVEITEQPEVVIAIFSKDIADGVDLEAGDYGIYFGKDANGNPMKYPGLGKVTDGGLWAVKLVGPKGKLAAGDYTYGVYAKGQPDVFSATAWNID